MMSLISKEKLDIWLSAIAKESTLIAPKQTDGVLLYLPIIHHEEIVFNFTRPEMSIKEWLFPATDRLMAVEKNKQQIKLIETLPDSRQVIFGVRPCDARGLKVLDHVFTDTGPVDLYYTKRRVNTTLIGLACQEMGESCFCTRVGGDLDDPRDVDIMLVKREGGYEIQVITEKGRDLLLPEWHNLDIWGEDEISRGVNPGSNSAPSAVYLKKQVWPPLFKDEYWEEMAERCLSCRICAYVCPTCRCFDIRDEVLPSDDEYDHFERIRCWDSCASEAYRRVAGGHNPRSRKGQRMRNRFFCKFYYYPDQYGPIACTGCGRCVDACPVNIDVTEVLDYLVEKNS
jgi:sulfhydrogenase subunit beta (sulfur reductase)